MIMSIFLILIKIGDFLILKINKIKKDKKMTKNRKEYLTKFQYI